MTRIDQLTVDFDVVDSAASTDKFSVNLECFLDPGRQTGGSGEKVSLAAIFDRDFHMLFWLLLSNR